MILAVNRISKAFCRILHKGIIKATTIIVVNFMFEFNSLMAIVFSECHRELNFLYPVCLCMSNNMQKL